MINKIKLYLILLIIFIFLSACSVDSSQYSSERSEFVKWAKEITKIEIEYKNITDQFSTLQRKLGEEYPTQENLDELELIFETISGFYTRLQNIVPPDIANTTHNKYKEFLALSSDAMLQYYIAVSQNDITYFEKSITNSKESNRIHDESLYEFLDLLERFSITCDEIDYCEYMN